MNCENVVDILRAGDSADAAEGRLALQHLVGCADCRSALVAVEALRAARTAPAPGPSEGSFARTMRRAVRVEPATPRRQGFWVGTAVGAALAASLAIAVVTVWMQPRAPMPASAPLVTLMLNEARDVNVAVESPEALAGAQIHVTLSGAIGLRGFDGQRELRWTTDLDRGVNQLTLPVVALGASGGQVLVEVTHGDRRRTFVIDVRALLGVGTTPTVVGG
jgi:hypothetical protein